MAWDEKKWRKEYAKKNREKMNAYARKYYKEKNRETHIKRVVEWKKRNPDKVLSYAKSDRAKEQRRLASRKFRENNKKKLRESHRCWVAQKKMEKTNSKIIVENAVERKFGWMYWINKEGDLCGTKMRRKDWKE